MQLLTERDKPLHKKQSIFFVGSIITASTSLMSLASLLYAASSKREGPHRVFSGVYRSSTITHRFSSMFSDTFTSTQLGLLRDPAFRLLPFPYDGHRSRTRPYEGGTRYYSLSGNHMLNICSLRIFLGGKKERYFSK